MEDCPYSLQLSAYHDGELNDAQRQQLEQHLQSACPACQLELRQWRRLSSVLSSAPFPALSAEARANLMKLAPVVTEAGVIRLAEWVMALAASVLIAVSTWILIGHQKTQQAPAESLATVAPLVLNTSQYTDLATADVHADSQFDDWVVTNLDASATHD